ncbi:hypothetical protein MRB53_037088 [Persea americana]|nr:hypothetical protein MRB53_037088 [Persea americana]
MATSSSRRTHIRLHAGEQLRARLLAGRHEIALYNCQPLSGANKGCIIHTARSQRDSSSSVQLSGSVDDMSAYILMRRGDKLPVGSAWAGKMSLPKMPHSATAVTIAPKPENISGCIGGGWCRSCTQDGVARLQRAVDWCRHV